MKKNMNISSNGFKEFIDIAISLSTENDLSVLLEKIVSQARRVTNADAGSLYLIEEDKLIFKIIQNDSIFLGSDIKLKDLNLPPLKLNSNTAASYCARENIILNIGNVYLNDDFDFTGPKEYDKLTGYNTRSMLVVPLTDKDKNVIGVLQLINSISSDGQIISFNPDILDLIAALASQAAISISNMKYIKEIRDLFDSFVKAIISAVDSRSPYNVNHTKNMIKNTHLFCKYLIKNNISKFGDFNEIRKRQLLTLVWLHDIGKLGIPLDIMDKSTRLGDKYELVMTRFDVN